MSGATIAELELVQEGAVTAPWPHPDLQAPALAAPRRWPRGAWLVAPLLDLVAVAAAAFVLGLPAHMPAFAAVGAGLVLRLRGAYDASLRATILDALPDRLRAAAAGAALAAVVHVYVDHGAPPPLASLAALAALSLAGLAALRAAAVLLRRAWTAGSREPALVLGEGAVAAALGRRLAEDPAALLRPVPIAPGDLADAAALTGARHVLVAFAGRRDAELRATIREAERLGLAVHVVPRLFDVVNHRARYQQVGGLPLHSLRSVTRDDWRFAVKHAFDRVGAALLLLAAAPLLVACALAVRISSPGPVLYRQRRVGLDGREFDILKFRSMRAGPPAAAPLAGAPLLSGGVEGADRRTRIGALLRRTSLDELPQLLNVLRGEMSLVGPRPERPEFVAAFAPEIDRYPERHRMRAGMTGWAQVHGLRGRTSIADRIAYDNHYIEHWSLWLDVRTLVLTVAAVLRGAE